MANNAELKREWRFETAGAPVKIITKLLKVNASYVLIVDISGLNHPYTPPESAFFTDETKNPAILPAYNHMKVFFEKTLNGLVQKHRLSKRLYISQLNQTASERIHESVTKPISNGDRDTYSLTFDAYSMWPKLIARTEKKQRVLLSELNAYIAAETPTIQKLLDDNRHLQPNPNPRPEDITQFVENIGNKWRQLELDRDCSRSEDIGSTPLN